MHRFIEKYSDNIKDKDAVKLIICEIEKAFKDNNIIEHLDKAEEMIKFYKELKGFNTPFFYNPNFCLIACFSLVDKSLAKFDNLSFARALIWS